MYQVIHSLWKKFIGVGEFPYVMLSGVTGPLSPS
jgi:hypothetical protein